ncbi:MAG: acetate kinase [Deltaproteobacteria bacterium]|nr:acetate kinase [Deltaproteobacteria bacterium]
MNILVLNCGSSSAKFAVVDSSNGNQHISGIAQRLGTPQATLDWQLNGTKQSKELAHAKHDVALRAVVDLLKDVGLADNLAGIGHRVVHGGDKFSGSMPLSDEVIAKIRECIPISPLHNPPNLLGIEVAKELFANLPQVAVFDTAFHQTMPPHAYIYPVPYEWFFEHRVRRYGFHGSSHRFVAQQAIRQLDLPPNNNAIITAHLGNGCSCTAIKNGKSVDTTMGLTPLEGVVMGTRSGSIDPTIVSFMAKTLNKPAEDIINSLNKKSGLLGISGLSNDMRALQEAATSGNERAKLAIDIFCYVLAKSLAGLIVPLGRLDALVFTGGIGENSAAIRAQVIQQLGCFGLTVDNEANANHGKTNNGRITKEIRPQAVVVPTNEELMIAIDTTEIINSARAIPK